MKISRNNKIKHLSILSGNPTYEDFYFSNFDLTYFNKYHMDFNPVKCITNYEALTTINWNGSL